MSVEAAEQRHPRFSRLSVSNFQSLEKADLDLGSFTVIIGPSNSGKSALLRALRAVARNGNGASSVKVGKNTFTAQVTFGATDVSIERGKSQSTYRVSLPDESEEVFTKAGRTVPDEVQKILGLPVPEGSQPDLTFSSQIDPPFLLSETGTVAAKTLGDLTNVSRLHAAAREANRRRLEAAKTRKIRHDDALGCATRLKEEFSDLPQQATTLKEVRTLMDSVRENARTAERLGEIVSQIEVAEAAEDDLRARLDDLPQPADVDTLSKDANALLDERRSLIEAIDSLAHLAQEEDNLLAGLSKTESEIHDLEEKYYQVLQDAGRCPTCGVVFARSTTSAEAGA